MSEDILSEDIELTENVRQGGNREREHKEETKGGGGNCCTHVGVTQIWQSTCHHRAA